MNTITITPKAKEFFRKTLQRRGSPAIELSVQPSGCSGFQYKFQESVTTTPDLLRIDLGDGFYFQVCRGSEQYLEGATVDFVREAFKERLVITNPKARATCGCGESFNV